MRVNREITAREVRVIDADGQQAGIMSPRDGIHLAEEAGLDLVEVSPNANPPVCRIADFGRMQYEASVKAREVRHNQKRVLVKEIKFRPSIDTNDYETKRKHLERFLSDGDRVKVTVMFRGREQSRPEVGKRLLDRLGEDLSALGEVVNRPTLDGRNMTMVISPKKA